MIRVLFLVALAMLAPLPAMDGPMGYETAFAKWIEPWRLAAVRPKLGPPGPPDQQAPTMPELYAYRPPSGKWELLRGMEELNRLLRLEITSREEAEGFLLVDFALLATRVLAGHNSVPLQPHSPGGIWSLQTLEKQPRLLPYEVAPQQKVEGERWNTEFNVLTGTGAIRRYRLA